MIALLLVTRNESGLLDSNMRHHFEWGFDHVAVADNHSSDSTQDVVRSYGASASTRVFDDFHDRQSVRLALLGELMERSRLPVEWAAISDTDEFFWAPCDGMRDLLSDVPDEVVAVNFDAKLYLPTELDEARGPAFVKRTYRSSSGDSPLHTSYTEGKTLYRASWLSTLAGDHWCKTHEHYCQDQPHPLWRHPEPAVHHYMVQDEDQFVDKVRRLIAWAKPPAGLLRRTAFRMRPDRRKPLPTWSEAWKKEWWGVFQEGGEEAVRLYYRNRYTIPATELESRVAAGELVHDPAFADYAWARCRATRAEGS